MMAPSDWLPLRKQPVPFWRPADCLIMLGTWIVTAAVCQNDFRQRGWLVADPGSATSDELTTHLYASTAAGIIAGLTAMLVTLGWLRLSDRDAFRRLGLSVRVSDIRLALLGALVILPPVFIVHGLLSSLIEYKHEVLEGLAGSPQLSVFLVLFVSTVVVTPIVEEFLFRLLLQGGLQTLADRSVDEEGNWRPTSYWPMIVAGLFFGLVHLTQGAAFASLFLFSLGLGFLYRQTGRIAVPILIHMILNAITMLAVFMSLAAGS